MQITERLAARFIPKVRMRGPDECWTWLACTDTAGYGHFWDGDKLVKAHRVAWEFWRGEIPEGVSVLHCCDNPPCCNPRHLWLGTQADNVADRDAKGRRIALRGEESGASKLTAEQVLEIYARYAGGGVYQRELGAEYGVDQTTISYIVRGEKWRHITAELKA